MRNGVRFAECVTPFLNRSHFCCCILPAEGLGSANMKSVTELMNENQHLKGHVCIRHDAARDMIVIEATKGGLLFLADVLTAQAHRLGNIEDMTPTRCLSVIRRASGLLS
jgi:hypothetical protein